MPTDNSPSAPDGASLVADWKRRRRDKKLAIADECLDAIRLRGLDPRALGITRARVHASLFGLTESDLDTIIERCPPRAGVLPCEGCGEPSTGSADIGRTTWVCGTVCLDQVCASEANRDGEAKS